MARAFPTALLMVLVLLGASASRAGQAEPIDDADRSAIRGVIEAQLGAFQADDGPLAFSYASPAIQRQFGTAENFMLMVRTGYLPVYRPRDVEFGPVIEFQGQPTQLVLLVGPDLRVVTAYYLMEKQPQGEWRINGCVLGEAPGSAT
jgi:hypothetical protein